MECTVPAASHKALRDQAKDHEVEIEGYYAHLRDREQRGTNGSQRPRHRRTEGMLAQCRSSTNRQWCRDKPTTLIAKWAELQWCVNGSRRQKATKRLHREPHGRCPRYRKA